MATWGQYHGQESSLIVQYVAENIAMDFNSISLLVLLTLIFLSSFCKFLISIDL